MRTDELSQKVGLTYLLPVEQGWRWSDCERWQATAADTVDRLSVVNVPRLLISTDAHYCRLAVRGYQLQSIHFCRITTPQTDATHTVITLKTHFLGNDLQCKCTTECHAYCSPLSDYTRWVKTTNTLDFRYHNFGKCRPIYKILSLSDSWGNFVHVYHKDSPPHLKCVSTLLCQSWKLQFLLISMSYCMWDLRIILQDMKPPQRLGSESCDYKIWKTMQQCLEEE